MKVNYYIDKRSKSVSYPVYMRVSHNYEQVKKSLGIKVLPQEWDNKINWIKGEKSQRLIEIKNIIESSNAASAKEAVRMYEIRKAKKSSEPQSLHELIKKKAELDKSKNSYSVYRKYSSVAKSIKNFIEWKEMHDNISDLNKDDQDYFFMQYLNYLAYNNYKNSTIKDYFKTINTVCNRFESIDLKIDIKEVIKSIKTTEQKALYCTQEEIKKLINLDLDGEEEHVRDCCVFQAFSGLRHNELYHVTEDCINYLSVEGHSIPVLSHVQNKSKKRNNVPLSDVCMKIICKYKDVDFETPKQYGKKQKEWSLYDKCLLPVKSNQKSNDILHKICEKAGISDEVSIVSYSGSKRIDKKRPKHELITTHTMRHSYAYYMKEKGLSDGKVADLMGIDENTYKNNYRHAFGQTSTLEAYLLLQS